MASFYQLPGLSCEGTAYSPGELLEGLILTESSGDPAARRYEPHQDRAGRTDAPTDPDMPSRDDGAAEDDACYGLCHVMGYNWRRILGLRPGTPANFSSFAYDPAFSIRGGLRELQDELAAVYRQHPHVGDDERMVRAEASSSLASSPCVSQPLPRISARRARASARSPDDWSRRGSSPAPPSRTRVTQTAYCRIWGWAGAGEPARAASMRGVSIGGSFLMASAWPIEDAPETHLAAGSRIAAGLSGS
jgi:hypothetical protein